MKTQKILIGTLVAGIASFFLGWVIYGMLLAGFMSENCTSTNSRPMEEMVWWAMIASNLVWGLLISIAMGWSGDFSAMSGLKKGAAIGLLTGFGFDLSMYAMSTMYSSFMVVIVDCIAFSVMFAISGALAGLVISKTNKQTMA